MWKIPTIRIDCRWWFGKVSAVIKLGRHTRMEYEYNPLGQLARKRRALVNRDQYLVPSSEQNTKNQELNTKAASTAFFWDGLALLQRGDESYLTEGHVSGGIPVNVSREVREGTQREQATQESSSFVGPVSPRADGGKDSHEKAQGTQKETLVNSKPLVANGSATTSVVVSDFLGTTLGTVSGEHFAPVYLTAFGEQIAADPISNIPSSLSDTPVFYTGKHYDEDLQAYHFLYRNYSPTQGRWTAADPSGFPDGPNQWLYVNNGVMNKIDPLGLEEMSVASSVLSGPAIYHIVNSTAVSGGGHSGMIVNTGTTVVYLSFGSAGSSGSASPSGNSALTVQMYSSVQAAASNSFTLGYTHFQSYSVSQQSAAAAIVGATTFANTNSYNASTTNCLSMVCAGLTAANVNYYPGSWVPNQFYILQTPNLDPSNYGNIQNLEH